MRVLLGAFLFLVGTDSIEILSMTDCEGAVGTFRFASIGSLIVRPGT